MPAFSTLQAVGVVVFLMLAVGQAMGHCDTMDGPVVQDARAALEAGDVTAALKWVPSQSERPIRDAFDKTLAVRRLGEQAKELADQYFFETLVRLHRAGEGEPFTGIQPAGTPLEKPIALAEQSLKRGDATELADTVAAEVREGIQRHFTLTKDAAQHKDQSVEAGRRYVAAYVAFMHYVEGLHAALTGQAHHGDEPAADPHARHVRGQKEDEPAGGSKAATQPSSGHEQAH